MKSGVFQPATAQPLSDELKVAILPLPCEQPAQAFFDWVNWSPTPQEALRFSRLQDPTNWDVA